MWLRVVVVVTSTLAFETYAGAALQSSRLPVSLFVKGSKVFFSKGSVTPQLLLPRYALVGEQIHKPPHLSVNSDQTITWDTTGLCLEASGEQRGDVVRFSSCTGGANQNWNYLFSTRRGAMVQLASTSECLDVVGKEGDSNEQQLVLQECDDMVTESRALVAPRPHRMRGSSAASYRWSRTVSYIVTVLLMGLVGVSALAWRWQMKTRSHVERKLPFVHTEALHMEVASAGSAFCNVALGGISLSEPLTVPRNQCRDLISEDIVPATMALAPTPDTATAVVEEENPNIRNPSTVVLPEKVGGEDEDAKVEHVFLSMALERTIQRQQAKITRAQIEIMKLARKMLVAMGFEPDAAAEDDVETTNRSLSTAFDLECERKRIRMREWEARSRSSNLARRMLDTIDVYTDAIEDVPSTLVWSEHFNGGLLPVDPAEDVMLTVKRGRLPKDLCGNYMRVGSNPAIWPPTRRTSPFDGDGMVHSIRIIDGTATYHCQFLETPRYLFEKELGAEWFSRLAELNGKTGLLKAIEGSAKTRIAGIEDWEAGIANTAIACTPEGNLWALYEACAPFRFRLNENGKPESLGVDSLQGTNTGAMSAHPKIDQRTGEVFFHGQDAHSGFFVARAVNGKVQDKVSLDVPPGLHHDMFITENFVVVVHGSTRFNFDGILHEGPLLELKPEEVLRFGVMRRNAGPMTPESFTWISTTVASDIIHTLYAYDEGDKIILWAPLSFFSPGHGSDMLGGLELFCMHRLVIDTQANSVKIRKIHGAEHKISEFPRIRDDRIGGETRYGYSASQSPGPGAGFNFTGILKWDFNKCRLAAEINFDKHVVGGEPVFIPKAKLNIATSEEFGLLDEDDDDGYIGMFLWNYEKQESTYALFDAHSFSPDPVVELHIPRRVPLGFHAAWITEEQFQKQLISECPLVDLLRQRK